MTSLFVAEHEDFVLKLKLKGEDGSTQVRRVRLPRLQDKSTGSVSYQELTGLIVSFTFPEGQDDDSSSKEGKPNVQITLTYKDVDQDIVTISSSEELVDAIEQYQHEKVLRIDAEIKQVHGVQKRSSQSKSASVQATPERKDVASGTSASTSTETSGDVPIGAVLDSFVGVLTTAVAALQEGMSERQAAAQQNVADASSSAARQAQRAAARAARLRVKATKKAERAVAKVGQKAETAASKVAASAARAAKAAEKAAVLAKSVDDSNVPVKKAPEAAEEVKESVPSSSDEQTKKPEVKKSFVHRRHTCDSCLATPIVGTRYHATNLPDYDLCQKCHNKYDGKTGISFEAIDGYVPPALHLTTVPTSPVMFISSSSPCKGFSKARSNKITEKQEQELKTPAAVSEEPKTEEVASPPKSEEDEGSVKVEEKEEEESDQEPPKEERPFIHGRHTCDSCLTTPIVGTRYHAKNLPDYDLCKKCHDNYKGKEIAFEAEELDRDRPKQDIWHARRDRYLKSVVNSNKNNDPFHFCGLGSARRGPFGGHVFGGHPFGPGRRGDAPYPPYPGPGPHGRHGRHHHPHGNRHHHHGPPPPPPPPPPPGPWGPGPHHHHHHGPPPPPPPPPGPWGPPAWGSAPHHPSQGPTGGWGDIFQVDKDSWKCEVCTCRNSGEHDRCPACESERPGTEKKTNEMPLTAADFNKDLEEAIRQSLREVVSKKAVETSPSPSAPTEEEIVVSPTSNVEAFDKAFDESSRRNLIVETSAVAPTPSAPTEEEIVVEPFGEEKVKMSIKVETVEDEDDEEEEASVVSDTSKKSSEEPPKVVSKNILQDESFASDALGSGDVAESIGIMLDKVAGEISDMLAAEAEAKEESGATILEDSDASPPGSKDEDSDDWHLVNDDAESESEAGPKGDDIGRAAEMLGSALFNSDMQSSGEVLSTLSHSHGDVSLSSATSVPSTVPSLSARTNQVQKAPELKVDDSSASHASEDQRARWAFQLNQLAELGFDNQDEIVDILERLTAANIGVESDEEVDVGRVVNELLKKREE